MSSSDCYAWSDADLAQYNATSDAMVASGQLTSARQADVRCHPDHALYDDQGNVIVNVKVQPLAGATPLTYPADFRSVSVADLGGVDPMAAAGADCGGGYRLRGGNQFTETFGNPEIAWLWQKLRFCYKKKDHRVRDWSGECSSGTTGFGTATLWTDPGCNVDQFKPLTVNGYYPGGIEHIVGATVTNKIWFTPDFVFDHIYVWGNYDGTCAHRFGSDPMELGC